MIYLGQDPVGIAVGVGKFTQYEKKTVAGVGNSNTYVQVSASFDPKLVVISDGTDSTGHVISGVMDFVHGVGGMLYRNSSNETLSTGGYRPAYVDSSPSVVATQCKYYDGDIYVSRVNSNGYFAEADTFTFEIYG